MARSLRQVLCTPHAGFPLTRKQNRTGGHPALHLSQVRGHFYCCMGLRAFWEVMWVAGDYLSLSFQYMLCMCSTVSFQWRWLKGYIYSSCYYHHHIGSINLTHCYHICPWLCAWDVCYIIFCHLLHIHSGKTGIFFSLLFRSLRWMQIVRYVLACMSNSFVCTLHHLIIIVVQTYLKTLNL